MYFNVEISVSGVRFVPKDPADKERAIGVSFIRTLRLPDDGKTYPLPPGLGQFPVKRVDDYKDSVPPTWREHGGVFLPMYQREALWLAFSAPSWSPAALKVAAGKINAVSGEPWSEKLTAAGARGQPLAAAHPDYVVVPTQPWLDGFNSGEGKIRQFVAMPLGMGYTVEGQLTGKEDVGGLQLLVVAPKAGRFNKPAFDRSVMRGASMKKGISGQSLGTETMGSFSFGSLGAERSRGGEMGLAAGGLMTQKIYTDPCGLDTWDEERTGRCFVHIVNSTMWKEITGEDAPSTPVSAHVYAQHKLPWFALYDEHVSNVPASSALASVQSVAKKDAAHGFTKQQDNTSIEVPAEQVKTLPVAEPLSPNAVRDGKW